MMPLHVGLHYPFKLRTVNAGLGSWRVLKEMHLS